MRPDDMKSLALMQAEGGHKMQIVTAGDRAAIRYVDGPDAGKIVSGTVVPIQHSPEVGLAPDELWKAGEKVHFGNAIVDVLSPCDAAFLAAQDLAPNSMQLVDAERSASLYAAMAPGVEASGGSAGNTVAG
ncbi:hypothetical protein LTR94_034378, partial [Friedmanniomyces endolithicus]